MFYVHDQLTLWNALNNDWVTEIQYQDSMSNQCSLRKVILIHKLFELF